MSRSAVLDGGWAGGMWGPLLFSVANTIPVTSELEQLHLGLYGMSDRLALAKEGSTLLTQKWHHTLRELDLSGQGFSEKDLEQALAAFSGTSGGAHPALCSLNLRGTRVTASTVRSAPIPQALEASTACGPELVCCLAQYPQGVGGSGYLALGAGSGPR